MGDQWIKPEDLGIMCLALLFQMWATTHFCRPNSIPTACDTLSTTFSVSPRTSWFSAYTFFRSSVKNKCVTRVSGYGTLNPMISLRAWDMGTVLKQNRRGERVITWNDPHRNFSLVFTADFPFPTQNSSLAGSTGYIAPRMVLL